jgi:hypothetical protein
MLLINFSIYLLVYWTTVYQTINLKLYHVICLVILW